MSNTNVIVRVFQLLKALVADFFTFVLKGEVDGTPVEVRFDYNGKKAADVHVGGVAARSATLLGLIMQFVSKTHMVDSTTLTEVGAQWAKRLLDAAYRNMIYRVALVQERVAEMTEDGIRFVRRSSYQRNRPISNLLRLTSVRLTFDPTADELRDICKALRREGLEPISKQGKRIYCVQRGTVMRVFAALGVRRLVAADGHILTRMAVVAKRGGEVVKALEMRGAELLATKFDGTIAISEQITRAYQVTVVGTQDNVLVIEKGMIRPPLEIEGRGAEQEGFVPKAQFRQSFRAGDKVKAYVLADARNESANTNTQAVVFTLGGDGLRFLHGQVVQMRKMKGTHLLTARARRFWRAGIPAAALVHERNLTSLARKFPVPGARGKVFASLLLEHGEIALLPGTAAVVERKIGRRLRVGEVLDVQRDPALPDGTGISQYRYAGVARFVNSEEADYGVVLAAGDPQWADQGGDFDGDAAVVWPHQALPVDIRKDVDILTKSRERVARLKVGAQAPVVVRGEIDLTETLVQNSTGLSERIGVVVNMLMQLAELEALTDELRVEGTVAIQGAIYAMKHRVDVDAVEKAISTVRQALNDAVDRYVYDAEMLDLELEANESGQFEAFEEAMKERRKEFLATRTFTGLFSAYKRASKEDAADLWACILELASSPDLTDLQGAMAELVLEVDRLGREIGIAHRSNVRISPRLKKTALAYAETDGAREDLKLVKEYARCYAQLGRELSETEDKDARRAIIELMAEIRAEMRLGVASGALNPYAVIAHMSARALVDIIDPEHLEALGFTLTEEVFLFDGEVTPGEYTAEELLEMVLPGEQKDLLRAVLNGHERAVLSSPSLRPNGYAEALVSVYGEPEITVEDEDDFDLSWLGEAVLSGEDEAYLTDEEDGFDFSL